MPKSSVIPAAPPRGVSVSPKVVSVPDTAIMTGLGESTVWAKLASGEIKSFRLGGRRMIRVEEVERFLADAEASAI